MTTHAIIFIHKADNKEYLTVTFLQNQVTHNVIILTPRKGKFPKIFQNYLI